MKKHRRRLSSFRRQQTLGEFTLRQQRSSRHRRAEQGDRLRVLVPLFVALMLLSLVMIAGILLRSVRTRRLNEELAAIHAGQTEAGLSASAAEEALPASTIGPTAEPEPTAEPSPAPQEATAARFHQVGGTPLAHMETLYNQNHDLIGWLSISEVIDLPVMYRDNRYYLTHDFNKNKNTAGTLFLDVNHRFTEKTQNLLLHGHEGRHHVWPSGALPPGYRLLPEPPLCAL